MAIEYVVFDILIRTAGVGNYTVDVRSPLGGDAQSTFVPPLSNPAYAQLAQQL